MVSGQTQTGMTTIERKPLDITEMYDIKLWYHVYCRNYTTIKKTDNCFHVFKYACTVEHEEFFFSVSL